MAAEKQAADSDSGEHQRRTPVLEPDCAVVVPASSVADCHHFDVALLQRNTGVSNMYTNAEFRMPNTWLSNDTMTDASISLQRYDYPVSQTVWCMDTSFRHERSSRATTRCHGIEQLENELEWLQMEDDDYELDENHDSALHRAVKTRTGIEEIGRLAAAAESAEDLDALNVRYQTALHLAVITDQPDVVRLLISRGASLHLQERLHGDTALHLTCRLGHSNCFYAISDACMKRSVAKLDTLKSILCSVNYEGETCLHLAARFNDKSIFYFMLYSFDIDVNVTEHKRGQSVLHEAVNRYDMNVINAVVSIKSFDVNLKTYDGLTALDMAISRRWTEARRVLVSAGSRTTYDVESYESSDDERTSDMDCS